MNKSRLIKFTLTSIVIIDTLFYINISGNQSLNWSTYVSLALTYSAILALFVIALNGKPGIKTLEKIFTIYLLFLAWNTLELIRGATLAKDYWDWKFLLFSSLSFSFIPLAFFVGLENQLANSTLKFFLKIFMPLGFLLIPLSFVTNEELYSRIMIPVSLFLLFIPYVEWKWKGLILLVAFVSVAVALGFRTNIIKISFSMLLLILYYLRGFLNLRILKLLHLFTFLVPILLLSLAIWGNYNFFAELSDKNSGYTVEDKEGKQEDLAGDTRTFLYVDVFSTLNRTGHWLIGEGAAGKYDTLFFDDLGDGRGRYSSEVGLLNILLYNGFIGVTIYSLLIFIVSRIAITKSNNIISKLLGLLIAFRWLLSFIEEFTLFDLNFYFFWIMIGLVSSNIFRKMTDKEIKLFFQSI